MLLRVDAVSHAYGGIPTLHGVSFSLRESQIVAVLGPSGCGKSTLLRLVAGLEPVSGGTITLDGEMVSRPGMTRAPERRGVGLVFQDYALFPHLDVLDNVLFGMKDKSCDRARDLLARVGLAHRASDVPSELSGGQQQRVALARALAPRPHLLLLDEPFSGLDSSLRESVRAETIEVLRDNRCAAIVVTHEPEEAMAIADRVIVLRDGRVEHDGTPESVYFEPATAFTARFLGGQNVLEGESRGAGGFNVGELVFPWRVPGAFDSANRPLPGAGTPLDIVLRPEGIELGEESEGRGEATDAFHATIVAIRWLGHEVLVSLRAPAMGVPLLARVPGARLRGLLSDGAPAVGRAVRARVLNEAVHAFARCEGTSRPQQ
jgi:iron(III) transport system ATP-binding protein